MRWPYPFQYFITTEINWIFQWFSLFVTAAKCPPFQTGMQDCSQTGEVVYWRDKTSQKGKKTSERVPRRPPAFTWEDSEGNEAAFNLTFLRSLTQFTKFILEEELKDFNVDSQSYYSEAILAFRHLMRRSLWLFTGPCFTVWNCCWREISVIIQQAY